MEKPVVIHSDRVSAVRFKMVSGIDGRNEAQLFSKGKSMGQCMHRIVSFSN